ncbi:hypothetical protein DPMN_187841 [Dreissena polymorpha]|uniref:NACHT domain-containing protein n=1 Tax=Dreissena polymorpha TaxID=45954 RepID=A0A9D4IAT4_DREPO|nr:hypothetical protein DPMN_187841 [Dreissena polymorpha]
MGKSTFLTKLALDWCNAVSVHNPDQKATFSDVDTLKKFQFLFDIPLRIAMGQREVIEMIKSHIINRINTGDTRKVMSKLLHQILERETCIVTLDGLNEWADVLHKYVLPLMANCHLNSIVLITSRPWKLADERIRDSEIDRLLELEGITDPEKLTKKMILSLPSAQDKTPAEFIEYVHLNQLKHFLTDNIIRSVDEQ